MLITIPPKNVERCLTVDKLAIGKVTSLFKIDAIRVGSTDECLRSTYEDQLEGGRA